MSITMRIEIKGSGILNIVFKEYIAKKFQQLSRFLKREEKAGESVLFVEVTKTTKHHKKGLVFYAKATLRLAHNVLRAEVVSFDVRSAIDRLKDIFKGEMLRYKRRMKTRKRR